jgi:hypothetical protein
MVCDIEFAFQTIVQVSLNFNYVFTLSKLGKRKNIELNFENKTLTSWTNSNNHLQLAKHKPMSTQE